MLSQAPESIFMIRPSNFGFNPFTAQSNAFQNAVQTETPNQISQEAQKEFDQFANLLIKSNIDVIVFDDQENVILPDAVFPNNWVSFHADGTVVLYPMMAMNRRQERRKDILLSLQEDHGFHTTKILDYTDNENHGRFLEGTGSIVFDYVNGIAYANPSPRTDEFIFMKLCEDMHIDPVLFTALDPSGKEIYHTNVMMCIGNKFVVICLDAIADDSTRVKLLHSFEKSGHEVIEISFRQLSCFAGNMIEVLKKDRESVLIMSESARSSLTKSQRKRLSHHTDILYSPIPSIEKYGGGSVRCMIAGIFLPRNS
jgi:hypothetical protein